MSTSEQRTLSAAGKLNAGSLVLASGGILIQKLSGVDEFPMIPPGAVILLTSGLLVGLAARWAWTAVLGVIAPVYLLVAAFLVSSGVWERLATPSEAGPFIGSAVQMSAIALAAVAGAGALRETYAGRRGVRRRRAV